MTLNTLLRLLYLTTNSDDNSFGTASIFISGDFGVLDEFTDSAVLGVIFLT